MGVFGAGTLMLTAQLVLVFSEQLHLTSATQIGMLAVVPLITQPLFLPWWARLFDGSHVRALPLAPGVGASCSRARRCALGVFARSLTLLWSGAVLLGRRTGRVLISAGISGTTTSPPSAAPSTTWACT